MLDTTVDTLVASTVSDNSGAYLFRNLAAGTYFTSVDPAGQSALTGYTATTTDQQTGTNAAGVQIKTLLAANGSYLQADFGFASTVLADVSGTVWHDTNTNSQIDSSEAKLSGVTMALLNSSGTVLATTVSAADGSYVFRDLPAGSYQIKVTDTGGVLQGYAITTGLIRTP